MNTVDIDIDSNKMFRGQISSLYSGIQSFSKKIESLHSIYKESNFFDWPTVLLGTLLQTTVISLFKLLPPLEPVKEPVDRRSIASLIRNIIDTHDVLDMLCNCETESEFELHRDILGYYLSDRINMVQAYIPSHTESKVFLNAKSWYWTKIDIALSKEQKNKIKSGESMFYMSRAQRLNKACGKDANFVRGILADLSTYVHSVPPGLWLKSITDAFDDSPQARGMLAVWLQIANFYYARSIRAINKMYEFQYCDQLIDYLNKYENVFHG